MQSTTGTRCNVLSTTAPNTRPFAARKQVASSNFLSHGTCWKRITINSQTVRSDETLVSNWPTGHPRLLRLLQSASKRDQNDAAIGPSEMALELARSYHVVQNPALNNTRYSTAIQNFTECAILAYECGHNEKDIDEQLGLLPPEEMQALKGFNAGDCLAMVCIVWITLMLAPQTVKRWAVVPAVSEPTLRQWRGFVAMIVNGYFERRMAWFPLDQLQLELSAVQGRCMAPDLVAEHARVVFTTLEQVYPQFPKD